MSISRRNFLGALTAGAGTVAGADKLLAAENFDGYPDRYGMLTDLSRCVGCRTCEAACNKQNKLPAPDVPFNDLSVLETKRRTTAKAYTVVNKYATENGKPVFRKIQCNHCNEPACVSACFVMALKKTKEGPVVYDASLCVGCRYCIVSCPFYIPAYEYDEPLTPRVMKCTMCYDKIMGEGGAPACAEACPMEAITFGKRSDLLKIAKKRIMDNPDKYIDHVYGEFEVGGTSWMYLSPVPFDQVDMSTDYARTPYPKYTKGALASVPVIVMLWPVLLGGIYYMSNRRRQIAEEERRNAVSTAIAETTTDVQARADKAQAVALKKAQKKAERDQKRAIQAAVKEALEKAADTGDEKGGE